MVLVKTKNGLRHTRQSPIKKDVTNASIVAELKTIFLNLQNLLSKEYERGGADAASRIMQLVGTNHLMESPAKLENIGPLRRAPRGASRKLVERALAGGPKTIREIREEDTEGFLSYQTVRLELERGKKEKRYKKNKDQWSLA